VEGLENHFLINTAGCVIEAALQRNESRGAHFRKDYPETDNSKWLKHLVIRKIEGKLKIEKTSVDLREIHPEEETS
jgi:succinate dehydrogenase/fumarate reductase flavoprotein subunit